MISVLVDVLTRKLEPILKTRESMPSDGEGLAGLVYPPVSLSRILDLTYSNAFHTQCIALKAEMSVGLEYEAPSNVERFLEEITGDQDTFLDGCVFCSFWCIRQHIQIGRAHV